MTTDAIATTRPINNASGVPHNNPIAKSRLNSSVPIIPKALPPMISFDSGILASEFTVYKSTEKI